MIKCKFSQFVVCLAYHKCLASIQWANTETKDSLVDTFRERIGDKLGALSGSQSAKDPGHWEGSEGVMEWDSM